MRSLGRILAGLVVVALTATAGSSASASSGRHPSPGRHGPPDEILGLTVQKEEVAKVLAGEKRPLYVDRVGLYSFREPSKLLQGTLEIAHFRAGTPADSSEFQQTIVGHLGSSVPIVVRVDGQPVYVTTSKGLTLAVWFRDDHMLALAIRNTYGRPKELLRQTLAINP
jgi:hypothetical protein